MNRQLRLTNISSARKSFAGVLRAYHDEEIDETRAKAYAYLFSQLLAFLKAEADADIEARLTALEERLP